VGRYAAEKLRTNRGIDATSTELFYGVNLFKGCIVNKVSFKPLLR